MQKLTDRPPYVRFENRPVEDRTKLIETGAPSYKDVVFAIITPAGSRDELVYVADEWLVRQREAAHNKRLPQEWLRHYEESYEAWKRNEEPPTTGTPLTQWPGLTPAQLANFKAANLRTVEDVAGMNEESIRRVGMGGRALQQRAQAYLDVVGSGAAAIGEQNAALREDNRRLAESVKEHAEKLKQLEAYIKAQTDQPKHAVPLPAKEFDLS